MKKSRIEVVVSLWHDNVGGHCTCTHDRQDCEKFVLSLSKEQERLIRRRLRTYKKQPKGTHLHISLNLFDKSEKNEESKEGKYVAGGGTTYVSRP
jgi:hypothetical protein